MTCMSADRWMLVALVAAAAGCGQTEHATPSDGGNEPACPFGIPCGTGCSDLSYDSQNCGQCGHACEPGLTCIEGACSCSGTSLCGASCVDLTIHAAGQAWPSAIALDSANIYWTDDASGTVLKAPKSGGNPAVLASGQDGPWDVAVHKGTVYWVNRRAGGGPGPAVLGVDPNGGSVTTLLEGYNYWAIALVVGGSGLYVYGAGGILWVSFDGSATADIATVDGWVSAQTVGLAIDSTRVYWTTPPFHSPGPYTWPTTDLFSAALDGSDPQKLASTEFETGGIGTDATSVFWASRGLLEIAKVGGATHTLSKLHTSSGIAVDDAHVYFNADMIRRQAKTGDESVPLATALTNDLAVDESRLYFSDSERGLILSVPK